MKSFLLILAVTFTWDPLTNIKAPMAGGPAVAGYKLFYGTRSGVYDSYWMTTGVTTTYSVAEEQLPADLMYFVCRGYNSDGVSKASNEVTYTKPPKPTPTPSPTPSPSPTATPTPTPTKRALTVYSGTGDGTYAPGTKVTVTADTAPALFEFLEWQGDINLLDDAKKSPAILTMPDTNASIMATYKRKM